MNAVLPPPEARPGIAFLVLGKLLPTALFAVLATLQFRIFTWELPGILQHLAAAGSISFLLNRVLSIAFATFVAVVYLVRQPPLRGRRDLPAVVVSMYASFVNLSLLPLHGLFGVTPVPAPPWLPIVSNVLVAAGTGFAVYALTYLRMNFSILPEARGLTTGGPYGVVRHPVYLGEIVGAAGLLLAIPSFLSLFVFVSFIAAQVTRVHMEERILAEGLPGYAEYARHVPRLFPFPRP